MTTFHSLDAYWPGLQVLCVFACITRVKNNALFSIFLIASFEMSSVSDLGW